MSESTEELHTAVQGMSEVLAEVENLAGQLRSAATELAEEAAGHGWQGMATRMEEVGDALEATGVHLVTGKQACGNAAEELMLITDEIPAEQVVSHLTISTAKLSDAVIAVEGAVEKADEADVAAGEIGQEGMARAASDLHDQLGEIYDKIVLSQAASDTERAAAEEYAKKQLGN